MCDNTVMYSHRMASIASPDNVIILYSSLDYRRIVMDKCDDTAKLLGLAEYSLDMCDDTIQLLRLTMGIQKYLG
jgi:hypothetical protein